MKQVRLGTGGNVIFSQSSIKKTRPVIKPVEQKEDRTTYSNGVKQSTHIATPEELQFQAGRWVSKGTLTPTEMTEEEFKAQRKARFQENLRKQGLLR